jgi:hypothetical protein
MNSGKNFRISMIFKSAQGHLLSYDGSVFDKVRFTPTGHRVGGCISLAMTSQCSWGPAGPLKKIFIVQESVP